MINKLKFKHYLILSAFTLYIWYIPWFFNAESSSINFLGVLLFILLLLITIKNFKK